MSDSRISEEFSPEFSTFPRAGFWRRIGAIIYDLLVVAAVIMFAAGAALALVAVLVSAGLISLAEGQDHASVIQGNPLFTLYIIAVILLFYTGFWRRGGQTLGMRAWRMRVQNSDGSRISWKQGLIRALTSLCGLGNFWVLFNREKLALQDKIAGCEVVVLTSEANQYKNWKRK